MLQRDQFVAEIQKYFVPMSKLPYYDSLIKGRFSLDDTLNAQIQDLTRALGSKGLRQIQITKLDEAFGCGQITKEWHDMLYEIIMEEEGDQQTKSHLELRYQIFGNRFAREQLNNSVPLPPVAEANARFRKIFEERSLIEITAAVGSIEKWYVPVAETLERLYLDLGYSTKEVETFTVHSTADLKHSKVSLDFVTEYADTAEIQNKVLDAVREAFTTVRLYDEGRFIAATKYPILSLSH